MESKQEIEEKIKNLLDLRVRPLLQQDGGDAIFRQFNDDGTLDIELVGACYGCPCATQTIKGVIEETLKYFIPEVKSVQQVEPE